MTAGGCRVDLHTHTDRSDGLLAPRDLLSRMRDAGMALVAITDHDTLEGAAALGAARGAPRPGMPRPWVLAGLEVNTVGAELLGRHGLGRDGEELHILGYGIDPGDPELGAALARQRQGRRDRIALTLERAARLGLRLDLEGASGDSGGPDAIGRPHVARALVAAGHATSVEDAFERYLDHGRPCYVPRQGMGPRDAIEAIGRAAGLAVLAHSPEAADRPEVMAELMGWGLRGLEVHYRSFPPEIVARLDVFAQERGLLATGGSDYHGDTMDYATAAAGLAVPDAAGDRLLEALGA